MQVKLTTSLLLSLFLATGSHAQAGFKVTDGDTITNGETVYRLNGVDAPEAGQTCLDQGGKKWPCGQAARAHLEDLLSTGSVRCEGKETDGYGRTIATCFLGGVDVGQDLVAVGLAWAFVRYDDVYAEDEAQARAKKLGVWSAPNQPPWDYRADKWRVAEQTAPDGCPIKGNISKNGRIYHAPWSPWYGRTKISTEKGERWFCSEAEAVAAGWRAPIWE